MVFHTTAAGGDGDFGSQAAAEAAAAAAQAEKRKYQLKIVEERILLFHLLHIAAYYWEADLERRRQRQRNKEGL